MPLGALMSFAAPVISGVMGAQAQESANETNIQLNRENRQWQEQMYNKYYSPQAMMQQYREAGLNPYLLGQNSGGVGQSAFPQSSAPNVYPANPMSGLDAGISSLLQSQQVSINSDQAKADITLKLAQAVAETYKVGGKKGVSQLFDVLEPTLKTIDYDDGMFMAQANSQIRLQDEEALLKKWQREFSQTFDPQRAAKEFDNLEASTKVLMSQVDLNQSNIDLNSSYMKHSILQRSTMTSYNRNRTKDIKLLSTIKRNKRKFTFKI